ncbi:MAG: hypothetical protein K0U34_04875, partial [Alphaproteobacteria bacterium]|nr:hypothetical protein [Alphaproteobacteria bacterium]
CCMLAGVVTLAQSKPPSAASLVLATASGAVAVKAADHSATPATAVTLRYEHFDLSALSASSYGDNEH